MVPEYCAHCGWGIPVFGIGGKGENILTKREAGGGGVGATRDVLSRGGSAGAARPGGGGRKRQEEKESAFGFGRHRYAKLI